MQRLQKSKHKTAASRGAERRDVNVRNDRMVGHVALPSIAVPQGPTEVVNVRSTIARTARACLPPLVVDSRFLTANISSRELHLANESSNDSMANEILIQRHSWYSRILRTPVVHTLSYSDSSSLACIRFIHRLTRPKYCSRIPRWFRQQPRLTKDAPMQLFPLITPPPTQQDPIRDTAYSERGLEDAGAV